MAGKTKKGKAALKQLVKDLRRPPGDKMVKEPVVRK